MAQNEGNLQSETLLDDERFRRVFNRWILFWSCIGVLSILVTTIQLLPAYLHDWRGGAVILLSMLSIAVYLISPRLYWPRSRRWPPSQLYGLCAWLSSYILVLLLILINPNFAWDLYATFGMTFVFFNGRRTFYLITVLFLTISAVNGVFTSPLSWGSIGAILGVGTSFYGITSFVVLLQVLIGERHRRNHLLRELSQAHTELEQAHRQLAESAAQEQELAVLRERTRLAREMHDTLGHALVLVSVKLEAVQRLHERDPQRFERELQETKTIVRESMQELRASIANLRSPALEREPACRALSRYAREMAQRADWRVTYDLGADVEGLPEEVEEALWKVGQEALTNIEKHAQARNVVLRMQRQESRVLLSIQDDGIGLPAPLYAQVASPPNHYGLSGMAERVAALDGVISLLPAPDHGTIVEVSLPLVASPQCSS